MVLHPEYPSDLSFFYLMAPHIFQLDFCIANYLSEEILLLLTAAPSNFLGIALDMVPARCHVFDSLYSPLDRI